MKLTRLLLVVLLVTVLSSACRPPMKRNEAELRFGAVYANKHGKTKYLGKAVEPDHFIIYAKVYEPIKNPVGLNAKKGDTFRAMISVGISGNESKYGSQSGVLFTVTEDAFWRQGFTTVSYWAESKPQTIRCTKNNKLQYSVEQDSSDHLRISTKTAGMKTLETASQGGKRGSGGAARGDNSRWYNCLLDGSMMAPE